MFFKSFHFSKGMQFASPVFAIFTAYWFSLTSKLNLPISNIEIASVFVLRALNNITKTLQRLKRQPSFLIAVMLLQVPVLAGKFFFLFCFFFVLMCLPKH